MRQICSRLIGQSRGQSRGQSGSSTVEMTLLFTVLMPLLLAVAMVGEWFEASMNLQLAARQAAFHAIYTESGVKDTGAAGDPEVHLSRQTSYEGGNLESALAYDGTSRFSFPQEPSSLTRAEHESSLWSNQAAQFILSKVDLSSPALVQISHTLQVNEASMGALDSLPSFPVFAQAAFPTAPWLAVSGQDANDHLNSAFVVPARRVDMQLGMFAMAGANLSLELTSIPVAPQLGELDFWADLKPDRQAYVKTLPQQSSRLEAP